MVLEAKADILKQLDEGRITRPESAILIDQIDPSLPASTHLKAIRAQIQSDWQKYMIEPRSVSVKLPLDERIRLMEEEFEFLTMLLGLKAYDVANGVSQIPTFKDTHRESNEDLSLGVIELPNGRKIRAFKEWAKDDDKRLPPTLLTIYTLDEGTGAKIMRPEIGPIDWPMAVSIDIDPLNNSFGNTFERDMLQDKDDPDLYHAIGEEVRSRERMHINMLRGINAARDYVVALEPFISKESSKDK